MGEALILVLIPTTAVLIAALIGWLDAPRAAAKRVAKLAARTSLALDDDTRRLVEGRLRRRQRGTMLGMVAGSLVGSLAVVMATDFTPALAWWVAAFIVGTGISALTVHVIDSGQAAAEPGTRAAVLRRRRLHDFMYPAETIAPFATLVLPTLAIVLAASSTGTSQALLLGVGAAAAFVVTATTMVAQRFVLHMAPPADSPVRLKWEDALRGIALRDLGVTAYSTSFALGAIATTYATTDALVGYPAAIAVVIDVAVGLGALGLIGLVVVAEGLASPARRFMRLYDDPATGVQR